jgi:hypothetical protein
MSDTRSSSSAMRIRFTAVHLYLNRAPSEQRDGPVGSYGTPQCPEAGRGQRARRIVSTDTARCLSQASTFAHASGSRCRHASTADSSMDKGGA